MKILQSRKVIYEGESLMLISHHGLRFRLCDQQFDSEALLSGRDVNHGFIDLKATLPAFDFFQIVLASDFQPNDNPALRNRLNWPDDGRKEPYYSVDGLDLFYEIRLNLLCIFSFGEVSPRQFQFTCEGIWELYPIHALADFGGVNSTLGPMHLNELLNHRDFNRPVFDAVWKILPLEQQQQFAQFSQSDAARQYLEYRDARVPAVDFQHLPAQLDDDVMRNIICYEQQDPALWYMLRDALSEAHKEQIAQFRARQHKAQAEARRAALTDRQKQAEDEREERAAREPHRFQGNMGEPDTISSYILMYGVDPRTGRKHHNTTEMTLQRLYDKLINNGCNRFYIEGIGGPQVSDVDVLGFSDNFWQVCYSEKGKKSPPIFTTADKDRAMQFYYDHITAMEHRHLVLATRSAEALEAVREKLESDGIRTFQNDVPDYVAPGDRMYRLFVVNGDIFKAKSLMVIVPMQDPPLFNNGPLQSS